MNFRLYFVFLPVLTIVAVANAQAPKHCCLPSLFTLGSSLMVNNPGGMFETMQFKYYFDSPNKRIATNMTINELYTKEPALTVYTISDFKKKMHYIIDNNTNCYKEPIKGNFPPMWCVPKRLKYTGAAKLGDTYIVNRWYYQDNQTSISLTTTPKTCVPVTIQDVFGPDLWMEDSEMVSGEFYDFKPSIDQAEHKFKPPAFCDAPLGQRKRGINNMLKSRFDIFATQEQ